MYAKWYMTFFLPINAIGSFHRIGFRRNPSLVQLFTALHFFCPISGSSILMTMDNGPADQQHVTGYEWWIFMFLRVDDTFYQKYL